MIDITDAQKAAEKEVREEKMNEAKSRIKAQIKRIETAKTVLANEQRVYEDLIRAIGDGN